ncbi:hypothetical protein [Pedobacter antarcticus]|uniref:hypothetical protein n=1 Tax=Pedobacter antarcticus TaxID=34086 RepID=UPI0008823C00|nr:hypothetical protein [Pedobacter antarcticus]SDL86204.1 hypothetical protein SAMN04488084_102707 [Pedobacter antarcticus]
MGTGKSLEDLSQEEIVFYLNQNKHNVQYTFNGLGATDTKTDTTELRFTVQHVNIIDSIVIYYSFPDEGGRRFNERVFHLKLQALPTKLNDSINRWVQEDITMAEQELMTH